MNDQRLNTDEEEVECSGYELADDFLHLSIRAYTSNGSALGGTLTKRCGKFIKIVNGDRMAILNLDNTTSLTAQPPRHHQ